MLGLDYLRVGDNEKAIEFLSYSLQLEEERLTFLRRIPRRNPVVIQQSLHIVVVSLSSLGRAYARAGNVEEAIKTYQRGLAIIKESGLKTQGEPSLYQGLGMLYLSQKDYPSALENLKKSLEMAERLNLQSSISFISSQVGNVFLQSQKPLEAIPYYRKAIDSVESTRSLLESEELRSSFFEDKRQMYAGMIVAHLRAKNLEEAFNYNERARSRAFLDILGSKVQLARGGALLEEERALQGRISALQAKMAGRGEDGSQSEQLRQELEAAQKAYTDFLAKIRKENKEQASLMNVEPLTLKQVQEFLDPGVTILEYFVTQQAVLLWIVEKDGVRYARIPTARSDLVSKVSTPETAFIRSEKGRNLSNLPKSSTKSLSSQP